MKALSTPLPPSLAMNSSFTQSGTSRSGNTILRVSVPFEQPELSHCAVCSLHHIEAISSSFAVWRNISLETTGHFVKFYNVLSHEPAASCLHKWPLERMMSSRNLSSRRGENWNGFWLMAQFRLLCDWKSFGRVSCLHFEGNLRKSGNHSRCILLPGTRITQS